MRRRSIIWLVLALFIVTGAVGAQDKQDAEQPAKPPVKFRPAPADAAPEHVKRGVWQVFFEKKLVTSEQAFYAESARVLREYNAARWIPDSPGHKADWPHIRSTTLVMSPEEAERLSKDPLILEVVEFYMAPLKEWTSPKGGILPGVPKAGDVKPKPVDAGKKRDGN